MRPPSFSVMFCAGVGFLAGWGLPRWIAPALFSSVDAPPAPERAGGQPASPVRSKPSQGKEPETEIAGNVSSTYPGVADPQVLAALENPDLIAAVRGLIAREQEDHCVDTRLIQLIESLPESRLAELPALLAANPGKELILRFVLTPWAERQPAAARAWATGQGSTNATVLTSVLTGWTRRDPAAAMEWATTQPLSTSTRALQISLIETLAETDPDRALAVLHDTGWIHTNSQAVLRLLKNWGSQDPTAALTGLRGMMATFGISSKAGQAPGDPFDEKYKNQFNGLLAAVLSGSASRSAADLADFIPQLTLEKATAGAESIARDYLMMHPEAAQALLANPNPGTPEKAQLLVLAENGAGGLLEKLMGFQDPAFRQNLLAVIASPASGNNPGAEIANSNAVQTAVLQALSETEAPLRGAIVGNFAQKAASSAPEFARTLWTHLDPAQQQLEGPLFMLRLAWQATGSALEIWKSSPPQVQASSLRGLVAGMTANNPQAALALAMQQSDPELRNEAVTVVLVRWGERAPQAAAAELERLAPQLDLAAMTRFLPQAGDFTGGGTAVSYPINDFTVKNRLKALTSSTHP